MAGVVKFIVDVVPTIIDWGSKGLQIYQTGEACVKAWETGKEIKEEGWSASRGTRLAGEILGATGGAISVGASLRLATLPGPLAGLSPGSSEAAREAGKIAENLLLCQKLTAGGALVSLAGLALSNYSQNVSIYTDKRVWNNLFIAGVALSTGFRISQTPSGDLMVTTLEIGKGLSETSKTLVDNIRLIQSETAAKVVYVCVTLPKLCADTHTLASSGPAQYLIDSKPMQKILKIVLGAFRPPRVSTPIEESAPIELPPAELEIPAGIALTNFPLIEITHSDYPDADYTDLSLRAFQCPLTKKPFRYPVVAWDKATGRPYYFERKTIIDWLTKHATNPYTQGPMKLSDLREHLLLRREIEAHLKAKGGAGA